jgi:hypothetical protein
MNYILTERAREKSTMYKYCTLSGYMQFFYFEIRVLPHTVVAEFRQACTYSIRVVYYTEKGMYGKTLL